MDVMPTFAALAAAQVPTDRVVDGEDIRHLFHGEFDKANPDKAYFYYLRVHLQAVRQGKWKLHLPREKEPVEAAPCSRNTHIAPRDRIGFEETFLVDLENDLGETTNLAAENPQVVERLLRCPARLIPERGQRIDFWVSCSCLTVSTSESASGYEPWSWRPVSKFKS
ncbi:MAG: hypothetical protein KDA72_18810 [Planctomycetales bacterium]|nr:hypothetical protein [Planctomycetales bacterium]